MALNKEPKGEECDQSFHKLINPIEMLKHSFYILSLTLVTLLLPLFFLLLSILTSSPSLSIPPPPYFVIYLIVAFLSLSSLFSLTGHLPKPRPTIAWVIVCSFQACITVGIEATIVQGIKPTHSPFETTHIIFFERTIFFLGIYETMMHWKSVFVKAVVDDTVYGVDVEEGRVGRLVVGAAFGSLWWWMLRDEVEPMAMDVIGGGGGGKGFDVWVVTYSTVVIGMVRVVGMVFWLRGVATFCSCGVEAKQVIMLIMFLMFSILSG